MQFSVLLCTHNPAPELLSSTLAALSGQTLPASEWELILIDNASSSPIEAEVFHWHPHGRVIREPKLGLTCARRRGIDEARGELLVFCDDDNLLEPDYLATAAAIFASHAKLGAAGGRSSPRYLATPPAWWRPFASRLILSDLGGEQQVVSWRDTDAKDRTYPPCAPTGSGMVLRREIGQEYARSLEESPTTPDRVGRELSSGGDCAMVLTALLLGWDIGYFPDLKLIHVIAARRLRMGYLARLNRASSESWVRLLAHHGICPWGAIPGWTVGLRQARAFFRQRAWRSPENYVGWAGACGLFAGRARIGADRTTVRE